MSPPPWTLFWPRSGFSPDPYLPTCPVSSPEVDQRQDVVGGVVVLRDPEGPADHRAVGLRVGVRHLADHLRRDPGHLRAALERPVHHGGDVVLEAGRGELDERTMMQVVDDDLAGHRVGEGDVGPDVQAEPQVAPLGRLGASRVDHDQPHPVVDPLQDVVEEDRVGGARVRAPEQHEVGVLRLFV